MAAPIPIVLLGNDGTPMYRGKTQVDIKKSIASCVAKPSFHRVDRAWRALGYKDNSPKPIVATTFHNEVEALWRFLVAEDRTKGGHRVRAVILDALNTMGYKLRGFTTDRKYLRLNNDPNRAAIYAAINPPSGNLGRQTAAPALDQYRASQVPIGGIPLDLKAANNEYLSAQWQRLHRYQGFCAVESHLPAGAGAAVVRNLRPLRAIPVPEGPDSLWHAISYWRGGRRLMAGMSMPEQGRPDIFRHWTVKGRIWTYFMQTIRDCNQQNVRWRDYWTLQKRSKVQDQEHGELSLVRSLHASPAQGRPAYPVWWDGEVGRGLKDEILWVVADYFATQIIVFYPNPIFFDPKANLVGAGAPRDQLYEQAHYNAQRPPPGNAPPVGATPQQAAAWERRNSCREHAERDYFGRMNPDAVPTKTPYFRRVYGMHHRFDTQILLVTSDWRHFDAVDYDHGFHDKVSYDVLPALQNPQLSLRHTAPQAPAPQDLARNTRCPYGPADNPPTSTFFRVLNDEVRFIPTRWWDAYFTLPATSPRRPPLDVISNGQKPCQDARFNILSTVHHIPVFGPNFVAYNAPVPQGGAAIETYDQKGIRGQMAPNRPDIVFDRSCWMEDLFKYSLDIPGGDFQRVPDAVIDNWAQFRHVLTLPANINYGPHPLVPANNANYFQLRFGPEVTLAERILHNLAEPLPQYLPKHLGSI